MLISRKSKKPTDKITILPAVKGIATVLMNTAEYKEKMEVLVRDENTYTNLNKDLSLFTNDTITIIDKQLYNDVGLYKECFGNYQSKVLGAVPNIISEANR